MASWNSFIRLQRGGKNWRSPIFGMGVRQGVMRVTYMYASEGVSQASWVHWDRRRNKVTDKMFKYQNTTLKSLHQIEKEEIESNW